MKAVSKYARGCKNELNKLFPQDLEEASYLSNTYNVYVPFQG